VGARGGVLSPVSDSTAGALDQPAAANVRAERQAPRAARHSDHAAIACAGMKPAPLPADRPRPARAVSTARGESAADPDDPAKRDARAVALQIRLIAYLRSKPAPSPAVGPEFLLCRGQRTDWLVRWPNGSVKWQSRGALEARHIAIPRQPLVGTVE
jgi:hypothetical protein